MQNCKSIFSERMGRRRSAIELSLPSSALYECLNKDYCYIAVLIGGQKFIWKRVERDQELIDVLTEQLVDFWEIT